jgi:acyl-CoA thioesterase
MQPDAVTAAMYARDATAQALGITISQVDHGTATATLTVRDDMTNGLGVCHGGIIFTLADAAMAYASNAGNERSLATSATVDFVAPAHVGQTLTALATQISKPGRSAIHDAMVRTEDGTVVATFRGRTLSLPVPTIEPN